MDMDLVKMKAYRYEGDDTPDLIECPIPDDIKDTVDKLRETLVEALVEQDDALMEKYFAGEELKEEELLQH